jgi:hypothetical protein
MERSLLLARIFIHLNAIQVIYIYLTSVFVPTSNMCLDLPHDTFPANIPTEISHSHLYCRFAKVSHLSWCRALAAVTDVPADAGYLCSTAAKLTGTIVVTAVTSPQSFQIKPWTYKLPVFSSIFHTVTKYTGYIFLYCLNFYMYSKNVGWWCSKSVIS